jgi:hypothetical protein
VRYEYNGSLIAVPYGQQLLLHQAPCLCAQRSKWLIHKKTLPGTRTRAIATGLAHSSGKLMGVATFESKQTNDLYLLPHLASRSGVGNMLPPGSCVDHDRKESAERNQEKRRTLPNAEKHHCERHPVVIARRVHNESLGLAQSPPS